MSNSEKWSCVTRYLAVESSEGEQILVKKWIKNDPEIAQSIERLQQIWKASDKLQSISKLHNMDIESEWERLNLKIQSLEALPDEKGSRLSEKKWHGKRFGKITPIIQLLRVAAIILVMLGGGYLLTQVLYTAPNPAVTELESEPPFREIMTGKSQLAGFELTDGSKVNLSVHSSLRLSNDYNRTMRKVSIEGHAYFDVLPDPDRPFVVETSHAILTVLGTDFTVRSYSDDIYVQLVVASGSVSIESRVGNGVTKESISKGQMAQLNKMTGQMTIKNVDPARYLGWMDGRIIFEETELYQVSRDLERWFGVNINITDADLQHLKLTAELSSRSLNHVMNVISHVLEVDYEIDEESVNISKRPFVQ